MAKQVWIENGIIVFYGNRAGYVREGYAVADPVFHRSGISFGKKGRLNCWKAEKILRKPPEV